MQRCIDRSLKPEAQEHLLYPPSIIEWARFWGSVLEFHPLNIGLRLVHDFYSVKA
jgi:hypothetical protein